MNDGFFRREVKMQNDARDYGILEASEQGSYHVRRIADLFWSLPIMHCQLFQFLLLARDFFLGGGRGGGRDWGNVIVREWLQGCWWWEC